MGGVGEAKNPRESYKTCFFWREAAGCYQRAPKGMIGEISRIKKHGSHAPLSLFSLWAKNPFVSKEPIVQIHR